MDPETKDIRSRADQKAGVILRNHIPAPLYNEVEKALEELLPAAAKQKDVNRSHFKTPFPLVCGFCKALSSLGQILKTRAYTLKHFKVLRATSLSAF